jgi:hypothetical protein
MATTSLLPSSPVPERLELTFPELYLARGFFGYNGIDCGVITTRQPTRCSKNRHSLSATGAVMLRSKTVRVETIEAIKKFLYL